jgi:gas vesicle protein
MGKIISVLAAAVGGFVAGVLLAPKSGKETREDLKGKADSIKQKSTESFDRASEEVKAGGRRLKKIASESVENIKENAREAREEVERRGENLKTEAERTRRSVERDVK